MSVQGESGVPHTTAGRERSRTPEVQRFGVAERVPLEESIKPYLQAEFEEQPSARDLTPGQRVTNQLRALARWSKTRNDWIVDAGKLLSEARRQKWCAELNKSNI